GDLADGADGGVPIAVAHDGPHRAQHLVPAEADLRDIVIAEFEAPIAERDLAHLFTDPGHSSPSGNSRPIARYGSILPIPRTQRRRFCRNRRDTPVFWRPDRKICVVMYGRE